MVQLIPQDESGAVENLADLNVTSNLGRMTHYYFQQVSKNIFFQLIDIENFRVEKCYGRLYRFLWEMLVIPQRIVQFRKFITWKTFYI